MLDTGGPKLDIVPRVRFLDTCVMRYRHPLFRGLVQHCGHDVPVDPEELDPVISLGLQFAHALTSFDCGL